MSGCSLASRTFSVSRRFFLFGVSKGKFPKTLSGPIRCEVRTVRTGANVTNVKFKGLCSEVFMVIGFLVGYWKYVPLFTQKGGYQEVLRYLREL